MANDLGLAPCTPSAESGSASQSDGLTPLRDARAHLPTVERGARSSARRNDFESIHSADLGRLACSSPTSASVRP